MSRNRVALALLALVVAPYVISQSFAGSPPGWLRSVVAQVADPGKQTDPGKVDPGKQTDPGKADPGKQAEPGKVDPGKQTEPPKQEPPKSEGQGTEQKPTETDKPTGVEKPKPSLPAYGYDFFANSRAVIEARRKAIAEGGQSANALTLGVGPDVLVPQPDRYQLGPGDKLKMRFWSPVVSPSEVEFAVDISGSVVVPATGRRVVLRGQTVAQAEKTLLAELRQGLRDAQATLELEALRSFQVTILGESYSPGTYQMPAVVTLFNAVYYTGGPTDRGSLRSIELRRGAAKPLVFDFYQYLAGDSSKDVPLQPGDVIYFPPVGPRVAVSGEVNRPGLYEMTGAQTLKDALAAALGPKPSGVTQRVSIDSVDPGQARKLIDVDVSGKAPLQNPKLFDGDSVSIQSIRMEPVNAVTLEGAVDQPGRYELTQGMTVRDLVSKARGLLPDAYPARADINRLNADGSFTLISIRLGDAMAGVASENQRLVPYDRVRIYALSEVAFLGVRSVKIAGAVARPSSYYRSDNMRLSDLILQAGGLLPTASETGYLQRYNEDGTNGPILRFDVRQVASGNAAFDLALADRDEVTIYTLTEAGFRPEQRVEVEGAVLRPGPYRRSESMTVKDLLEFAGNLLPDAYAEQAYLQRYQADGKPDLIVKLDLKKALVGDPENNLTLRDLDKLVVYKQQEAAYTATRVVSIQGAVLRPGLVTRFDNMRLKDLIDYVGGRLPNASDRVEVASARVPVNTPPAQLKLSQVLAGDESANVLLRDGDAVTVPYDSEIRTDPVQVQIRGAVKYPGTYTLVNQNERLSDVVRRAGGLLENSFPAGGQFLRDPKLLQTESQARLTPRVEQILKTVSAEEYKRELARSDVDKIRASSSANQGGTPAISLGGAPPAQETHTSLTPDNPLFKREIVSPARPLTEIELKPGSNVNIDFDRALRERGGRDDVVLLEGDIIYVPERPSTVAVIGAVVVPSAVVYVPGKGVDHYVVLCGGLTADADTRNILLIRATGSVVRPNSRTKIAVGDTLFIPTKVMSARLKDKQAELEGTLRNVANASIAIAVIRTLTGG